jgi:uncharacterized repeat protein (TIGR03803 family)
MKMLRQLTLGAKVPSSNGNRQGSYLEKEITMTNPAQYSTLVLRSSLRWPAFALVLLCALIMMATQPAQAQTFTVIHNFTGGQDGAIPETGLTLDVAGNLYGTTNAGGQIEGGNCPGRGCGIVFKMTDRDGSWPLTPLCTNCLTGSLASSRPAIAPNGVLYGTTLAGGLNDDGLVYQLRPPAQPPRSILSPWSYSRAFSFNRDGNGFNPQGDLTFDQAGNIYGTDELGGNDFNGVVYELTSSGGGWNRSVLYAPSGGLGSQAMMGGVLFDHSGNLYGVENTGGSFGVGAVYELSPSGSGWTAQIIYSFQGGSDGSSPEGGLLVDASSNLYGTTNTGGSGGGGTVFELTPSGGGWNFNLLYSLSDRSNSGPTDKLAMDAAGNLYGVTYSGGAHQFGSVFKLTPSGGGWNYTSLHDFTGAANDGAFPLCGPIMEANGNLYGTASQAGAQNKGNVWEITP